VGDVVDFVVTVRVSVEARTRMPQMPSTVVAEAHAGPVTMWMSLVAGTGRSSQRRQDESSRAGAS
jgi:hypothetical protein